jgi:hypothetical protein
MNGSLVKRGVSQQSIAGSKETWHLHRYQILWSGKETWSYNSSRQINYKFHKRSHKFPCFNCHTRGTYRVSCSAFQNTRSCCHHTGSTQELSGYTWDKISPKSPIQWQIQPYFPQSNHKVWGLEVYNENEDTATVIKKIKKGGGDNK